MLEKQVALQTKLAQLHILETDIIEKFIRGNGKGGQKINTTASCVQLFYIPLQITIRCQKTRSREDNRYFARRQLCDAVDLIINGKKSSRSTQESKIRKQKQRRSRRRISK